MDRERTAVTGFLILLLALWLSFALHQSPRFPGSALGGVLGVSAALLMLVPLAYALVKRMTWLKASVATRIPLSKILAWHVYASIVAAFLAILHSGHRFQSWLGILLISTMLLSIISGYIGPGLQEPITGNDASNLLPFRERDAGIIQHDLPGVREPDAHHQVPADPVAHPAIEHVGGDGENGRHARCHVRLQIRDSPASRHEGPQAGKLAGERRVERPVARARPTGIKNSGDNFRHIQVQFWSSQHLGPVAQHHGHTGGTAPVLPTFVGQLGSLRDGQHPAPSPAIRSWRGNSLCA